MKSKFLIILHLAFCSAFAVPQDDVAYPDTIVYSDTTYEYYEDEAGMPPPPEAPYRKKGTGTAPTEKPKYATRTFSDNLSEKYNGSEFNYKEQPKSKSTFERFMQWLMRLINGGFIRDGKGNMTGAGIVWYIVTILIILVVAYLIAWAIMGKQGKWIFGRGRKNIKVYDVDDENIYEMDFATLIDQTQKEGNYRLAIRYYYLWLLKKMSFADIITWHTDKTNNDYYYEIKDTALRDDFKYLSYVYDHSWYGEFPVDNTAFAKAQKAFLKTLNKLS